MPSKIQQGGFDTDFDTFWKEVLDLIEPATAFFLPELHQDVDWTKDHKSIEQELRGVFPKKRGTRRIDKLFRLHLNDGSQRFVLFHIEAEAYLGADFPRRMFRYHAMLTLKFDFTPITVLALFVGESPGEFLDRYTTFCYGTDCHLKYNTFTIADQDEETLIRQDNPLALAVLANLYVIQSRQDPVLRMKLKRKLVEHLQNKNVTLREFNQIINFALHFVRLPEEDEVVFQKYYFEKENTEDMTGREKALAYGQSLRDNYVLFLEEKLKEKLEEKDRAHEAAQRAHEAAQRAHEAAKLKKTILNLHQKLGIQPEQIAVTLEIELATVLQALDNQ